MRTTAPLPAGSCRVLPRVDEPRDPRRPRAPPDAQRTLTVGARAFPGKLNLFQRTMLRWRALAPYNAVHVARVDRTYDADGVRAAIDAVVRHWGIGGIALDGARRRYVYRGGSIDIAVSTIDGDAADDGDAALAGEVERQLNLAFAIDAPFRFFVVRLPQAFMLGVAYDHYIAGGDAVAMLLGTIVESIAAGPVRRAAPALYPPTYAALLRARPAWFLAALAAMPALVRESKRAMRPPDHDPDDARNAYALVRVAPTDVAALRGQASDFGVTLHDLLIALLLRALSPLASGRGREATRREIGVASIVNIRKDFAGNGEMAFGQLLASMRVTHPVPAGIGVADLARDVRAATLPVKRRHLYLSTLFGLAAARWAWPFMSTPRRNRFYAKHHPAWVGVSMLDVDTCWPASAGAAQRYTRAVSTGPLTPAVLAISTTATSMSLGISWRRSALSDAFPRLLQTEIEQCARA